MYRNDAQLDRIAINARYCRPDARVLLRHGSSSLGFRKASVAANSWRGTQDNLTGNVDVATRGNHGLLIAFIAARVWANVAKAKEHVEQEATALSEVILLSGALPFEIRTSLREVVRNHIAFIEEKDWPA